MAEHSLTRRELLEEAKRRQLDFSRDKLDRWVRAGLVPRPITRNLGGRGGRESIYPEVAIEQVAAVCDALRIDRRLDNAAFLVWWWGFDIEMTAVRGFLRKIAEDLDHEIKELRSAHEDGTIDQIIQESGRARVRDTVMGRARRRVGRDAFPTVVRILIEVGAGSFFELHTDYATDEDEGVLFEQALGLARARSDALPDGSGPWLTGAPEENLRDLSSIMSGGVSDGLGSASNEDLVIARTEVGPILDVLAAIAPPLEAEKGKDAYGITELGRVLSDMAVQDLARFFLIWLKLRSAPLLQPGIEEVGRAAREALGGRNDA